MESKLEQEILRLKRAGLGRFCVEENIKYIAALTMEINRLKKEKDVIICAHVYQRPEIISGIADIVGDSYKLAKESKNFKQKNIIFCGVYFMAETASILNPDKNVYIPDIKAGCSLSESITAKDVRKLRKQYPEHLVVSYINTSAEVKAESDVIVTSANAERILNKMLNEGKKIIFLPDKYMGKNLEKKLEAKFKKNLILWNGSCVVHEKFDVEMLKNYRLKYPNMLVLAHSECPSEIIDAVDFMGGTSDMMKYIAQTNASSYMLITECGFGELAMMKYPEKNFIAMCRLCPYMKRITLEKVLYIIKNLPSENLVKVPPEISKKAIIALEKMFELSQE